MNKMTWGKKIEKFFDPSFAGEKTRALLDKIGPSYDLNSYLSSTKRKKRQVNPIAPNAADIVNWVLYDRYSVATTTSIGSTFSFFTQPIGTNNKTKADTNLDQVQRLPDPLWFNTVGVGFQFSSDTVKADIDAFLNDYYMEFWVGQKVYLEGPFESFPGAAGLTGTASAPTAVAASAWTVGVARTDNFFDVRLPQGIQLGTTVDGAGNGVPIVSDGLTGITILQGQQFKIQVIAPSTVPTTTAAFKIRAYLLGILSRGVQ